MTKMMNLKTITFKIDPNTFEYSNTFDYRLMMSIEFIDDDTRMVTLVGEEVLLMAYLGDFDDRYEESPITDFDPNFFKSNLLTFTLESGILEPSKQE